MLSVIKAIKKKKKKSFVETNFCFGRICIQTDRRKAIESNICTESKLRV